MKKILVCDGKLFSSLAIVRSLGEKGFEIHCGEEFKLNLTSFSKYVSKKIVYPSPLKRDSEFIVYILKLANKEKYDLIIPVGDETTILFSKHRDKLSKYCNLFLADYEVLKKFEDKGETVKFAQKYGIPTPQTYFPENQKLQEIKEYANYPVLVRARISSGSRGIKYVASSSEFDDAYHEIKKEYGEPIIQEYISHEGGHYSIGTLFNQKSEPVAVNVYKETKQYPINGGPAVNAVSVEKDEWVDSILKILSHAGWKGPAHMDVLYDISSNTPRLLEVNPRFWMGLNLSIQAGVDFPYLLYNLSKNKSVDTIKSYKIGMKYRWVLPGEILRLMQTQNKFQEIKDILKFNNENTCYASLSFNDPLPVLGTILQSITFILSSEKRKFVLDRKLGFKGELKNETINNLRRGIL